MAEEAERTTDRPSASEGSSAARFATAVASALAHRRNAEGAQTTASEPWPAMSPTAASEPLAPTEVEQGNDLIAGAKATKAAETKTSAHEAVDQENEKAQLPSGELASAGIETETRKTGRDNELNASTGAGETEVSQREALGPRLSDRARVRNLIRAQLAEHRPRESAPASLELVAESTRSPSKGVQVGNEVWSEDAVPRGVEELRRSHPQLFQETSEKRLGAVEGSAAAPDNPRDEASGGSPKGARDWLFLGQRGGICERQADDRLEPLGSAAIVRRSPLASYRDRVKELGAGLARRVRAHRDGRVDGRSAARHAVQRPMLLRRYVYAAFAVVFVLFAFVWLWPASKPLGPGEMAAVERTPELSGAREAKETSSLSGQPTNGNQTGPAPYEPPGILRGVPEVIDTATIRFDGNIVRLFGVEWVRGGRAEGLADYLRGREVECELASAPDRYRCQVGGHDLSRVVLFNGGGRATTDASPELLAAENHAKAARRGVWQK
jgi:endonuclease YncB( thermonuclease family)